MYLIFTGCCSCIDLNREKNNFLNVMRSCIRTALSLTCHPSCPYTVVAQVPSLHGLLAIEAHSNKKKDSKFDTHPHYLNLTVNHILKTSEIL